MSNAEKDDAQSFDAGQFVTPPIRVAAAWSWRILVIAAAVALLLVIAVPVRDLVVSVALALLMAALVSPLVGWLKHKCHLNNTLAAVIGLLVGIGVVAGLLTLALGQLIRSLPSMFKETTDGILQMLDWINDNVLDDAPMIGDYLLELENDMFSTLKNYSGVLASEAWSLASSAVGIAAATLLVFFVLFFFLKDGRGMWIWCVRLFPAPSRSRIHEAGLRGWVTLGAYIRTQIQVAAIDAVGIGLGAFFLGVPLAIPIAVLVFLCSFVPIVGAFVSGAVAVFLALVNNGMTTAIIMLLVVLAVQQLESNVLHPWMMSHAVSLHPVATLLAVAAGTVLMGIPGAVFAVPILAVTNAIVLYLHGHDPMPHLAADPNRSGGAPGTLEEQIAASYRGRKKKVAVSAPKDEEPETQEE